jgi:hypothetical protein
MHLRKILLEVVTDDIVQPSWKERDFDIEPAQPDFKKEFIKRPDWFQVSGFV